MKCWIRKYRKWNQGSSDSHLQLLCSGLWLERFGLNSSVTPTPSRETWLCEIFSTGMAQEWGWEEPPGALTFAGWESSAWVGGSWWLRLCRELSFCARRKNQQQVAPDCFSNHTERRGRQLRIIRDNKFLKSATKSIKANNTS